MKTLVLYHLLVVLAIVGYCQGKITITKLEIQNDPNYLKIEHKIHTGDDGKTYVSANSEVLQDINEDILVSLIRMRFLRNIYLHWVKYAIAKFSKSQILDFVKKVFA